MITIKLAPRKDIKAVIFDDEIYDRITDDNCPPKELFELPQDGYVAIGGYIHGKIASMFIVHDDKLHFMVLKPYRLYAWELLRDSFKFYPHNVYVQIPSLYKPVINFAKNFGFKETLVTEKTHKKNNCWYDIHTLTYEVKDGLY